METTAATFFDLVRADLNEVEARMRSSPEGHHPQLDDAIDHLLSSGGKRLRPILVLLTCGMLGVDCDASITLAAAVEMLHTATLVHDDLIDGSLIRRGYPTLNAKLSLGATVLTGDYIFARAAHLASGIGSKALMSIFSRTLMTIVNGEISQLFGSEVEDARQEYFDRIYAKTASLFEVSCEGAALLSESGSEVVTMMKSYGYNVGIAFQIVDDILDFISEEEQVGKPVANDLRQGLITLPTLYYLESNPEDGHLHEKLVQRKLSDDAIERLIQDIRNSGAIDQTLEQAEEITSTAKKLEESMPPTSERDGLCERADYVVRRTI